MRLFGMRTAVVGVMLLAGGWSLAADMVGVSGSKARFPSQIEVPNGGKPVKLTLTGTALRTRTIINVYAMASYVQDGVMVKTADQLAAADNYKALHLIMERDISGKEMAETFTTAIRKNHPQGFTTEIRQLQILLGEKNLKQGQEIHLTWLPKAGLRCQVKGQTDVQIANPAFARAVWDIYFGKQNLSDSIKTALASRLP